MDVAARPVAAINPLVADTGTPPIPEAQAWLTRYRGAFGPAINMSQAVPGHPPHPDFMARLLEAAGSTEPTRYGPITGDADLRESYAAHLTALYGGAISTADVAITAGCNMGFVVTLMLVAKSGDNILLPSPWYFNHEMTAKMLGVEARALSCDPAAGFVPDADEAERLIDARTKAIVLVTPNNPTGAVYPDRTIQAFADLCRRRCLWLIIDETYRDFLPPSMERAHGLFECPAWRDHVIQLYSFSKAYCIPGYRLGAVLADATVIGELAKILDCIQICAPRIGQRAAARRTGARCTGAPKPSTGRSASIRSGWSTPSELTSPMCATPSTAGPPSMSPRRLRSSAACSRCRGAISARASTRTCAWPSAISRRSASRSSAKGYAASRSDLPGHPGTREAAIRDHGDALAERVGPGSSLRCGRDDRD
jgi:aspartate/methionine/tyrosine aminotransferase